MNIESHKLPSWLDADFSINIWPISDQNPYVQNPRAHTICFYELIWIFSGEGYRIIDGIEYRIQKDPHIYVDTHVGTEDHPGVETIHGEVALSEFWEFMSAFAAEVAPGDFSDTLDSFKASMDAFAADVRVDLMPVD